MSLSPSRHLLALLGYHYLTFFFLLSDILEGRAEHGLDAIGSERTGEVVRELDAELLLDLAHALLRDTEGLGASLVIAGQASNHTTAENLRVCRLEGGSEGLQGGGDALAVLGALHGDILTQPGVGDDATDGSTVLVTHRLVDGHTARGHRTQAGAHVVNVELEVGRDGLGAGVGAKGLLSLLERGPELLGSAGATVERTGVGLDMLLTLGSHPHASVGREGRLLGGIEFVDGDEDAHVDQARIGAKQCSTSQLGPCYVEMSENEVSDKSSFGFNSRRQ